MSKWIIKKIKNKNSDYDFRLLSKNNDYSDVNFFKYSYFRILVSLSSYLSNGVIFKNSNYKILKKKKVPAIFDSGSWLFFRASSRWFCSRGDLTRLSNARCWSRFAWAPDIRAMAANAGFKAAGWFDLTRAVTACSKVVEDRLGAATAAVALEPGMDITLKVQDLGQVDVTVKWCNSNPATIQ